MFNPSQSQSFDDFEAYNKQQPNRSRALADNLAAEKEKMNAVAKIKVVVRCLPIHFCPCSESLELTLEIK